MDQMDIQTRDKMFETICEISDQNVDPQVKKALREFIGRPNDAIKDELLGLIDDIVWCAWTSDFELHVLHVIWESIGGSKEELDERNSMLRSVSKIMKEEMQLKYKWRIPIQER